MALVKCKECGEKVSTKAKSCPNCGAKPPKKTSIVTWAVLVLILFGVYGVWQAESSLTPEQRKAREEQRAIAAKQQEEQRVKESAQKAAEEKEKRLKGFHCLSSWDGSHTGVKKYVEDNMRDPDSFEHIETRITPVSDKGTHQLVMKYRAKNGFGGMTVGVATATIDNASCKATITSIE
ncbi:hypothetical protein ACXHPE_17315 [Vibrio cincinnatiensis]|uniref:zinc ribbon domain-containing protein n=1 Tax=Vibrio cincinnatiensis TaxID=675 RepID=UPI001EDD3A91|nr:hypothetical protein [Vibrio cincinnatiensis]MCG3744583.1 hypothetical protein [Vibrio cincinnatiensis]